MQATVLNVQRMSTEDGPGIRTTVFLKGCSLACRWCHNPESIAPAPQTVWHQPRCLGCGSCVDACPQGALTAGEAGPERGPRCVDCQTCVHTCPTRAMERLGETRDVEDLLEEVLRDRAFYEPAGGGVTLSGGEPALQTRFCVDFMRRLQGSGVHVALDTCGQCSEDKLLTLARHADLVLYDLKTLDPATHERLTGQPNHRILSNLSALGVLMRNLPRPPTLWIRTPLIPGDTDTEANITAIGAHLARGGLGLQRWELTRFNPLCADKYQRLGRTWPYDGARPQPVAQLRRLAEIARRSGVDPRAVHVPGVGDEDGETP